MSVQFFRLFQKNWQHVVITGEFLAGQLRVCEIIGLDQIREIIFSNTADLCLTWKLERKVQAQHVQSSSQENYDIGAWA